MPNKTRKRFKQKSCKKNHLEIKHIDAKKGATLKCRMKTCRAHKYKSVYGSTGGNIRSNLGIFDY